MTIIRAGRTVETGTLADLRHLTRITIEAETAEGGTSSSRSSRRAAGACSSGSSRAGVTASLVSHPPTLEELFLRHYAT